MPPEVLKLEAWEFNNKGLSLDNLRASLTRPLPPTKRLSRSTRSMQWPTPIWGMSSRIYGTVCTVVIVKRILEEIDCPQTEIFPKQDCPEGLESYGNFIFTPLFGRLVSKGKTVFVDPYTLKPYKDQWEFLKTVKRAAEPLLDEIIELNALEVPRTHTPQPQGESTPETRFSLPSCARTMLQDGVSQYQRVSCFRLAVHLKRLGLPQDVAASALKAWAQKNRPSAGKRIITDGEILEQITYAFARNYRTYGCESEAVKPFCHPRCPVRRRSGK